jgi:hypothetical protein
VFETEIAARGDCPVGLVQVQGNRREFDKIGIFEAWCNIQEWIANLMHKKYNSYLTNALVTSLFDEIPVLRSTAFDKSGHNPRPNDTFNLSKFAEKVCARMRTLTANCGIGSNPKARVLMIEGSMTWNMKNVTYLTRHTSHATRHMSHVTRTL